MKYLIRLSGFPISCLLPLFFLSCTPDTLSENPAKKNPGPRLEIHLEHQADGHPLLFDSLIYPTPSGNPYSVQSLSYYLSYFSFYDSSGMGTVAVDSVFYINGKSADSRVQVIEDLPLDNLMGLSFNFGLPPEVNVTGRLPPSDENASMIWPANMGGGYHHLRIEGKYRSGGETLAYSIHLGNSLLDGVRQENHFEISLSDLDLNLELRDTLRIRVVVHVDQWLRKPNDIEFGLYDYMAMHADSVQKRIRANGMENVFEIRDVNVLPK